MLHELLISSNNENHSPIEAWAELINSDYSRQELAERLRRIYRSRGPCYAEIILEGKCPNRCEHCIYHPDYPHFNKTLAPDKWFTILNRVITKLEMRKVIFDGRSYTHESLGIIRQFRRSFPEVLLGLISDGPNLEPYLGEIEEIAPDWIDISIDGLEEAHDQQRNRTGSFRVTHEVLRRLKASGKIPKINILTCLTTLNVDSVLDMIRMLNLEGFKNFFLSPFSYLDGYRPDPKLKLSKEEFAQFAADFVTVGASLSNAWLEIDIYEPVDLAALREYQPDFWSVLEFKDVHLECTIKRHGNEMHIVYYPLSLTGLVDFIVNCDGRIILPKTMAMGRIPASANLGSVIEWNGEGNYFENWMELPGFDFCLSELVKERELLGSRPLSPLMKGTLAIF